MSNKHDANVRKSTLVNFQIGLIASLLFTYVMFEVQTASKEVVVISDPYDPFEPTIATIGDVIIEETIKKEPVVKTKPKKVIDLSKPKIVDNGKVIDNGDEYKNKPSEVPTGVAPSDIEDINSDDETPILPFDRVESVPIFPGCEKLETNKEKAACFSEKVRKIVSRKFNTGLGDRYGLSGIQRIYTQFDVDANGMIKNIRVRAPHPKLEQEAERVINLFPEMTPGKQRNRPVVVKYQLPIVFKIQD